MTLGDLIERLREESSDTVVPMGFSHPHSYRGHCQDLAFEPERDTTVGEMLAWAESALGSCFPGYKGGEFEMTWYTDVWLATYGCTGETIGHILLDYMLGKYKTSGQEEEV